MKKFFRALAVVLALTLVIGTIPASAAEVTVKPMKSKQLYLGGTKGFKTEADGTIKNSTLKEKVSYWRLLGITKDDAKELGVTATSDKEKVASVDDTTMKVKGEAMGDANITLKAGDASYTIPVAVKKSATKVIFGGDFAGVEESKDITINTEYVLSVPRFEDGVKMDTDQRTMTITDKDGKDVTLTYATKIVDEKDPKIDTRTWKVKFTEGGTYTVKAWSYQSLKKYPGATAEKTITVNVKEPNPVSITQTASNAFEIKFDADIEKLGYYKDAHDWDDKGTDGAIANRVYYKVGGVVVPFSSVKSTTPKEDKLTVVMYGPFVAGETYYAEIAGQTLSFVAAGNKAKDVASIAITKKTAVANVATAIEYKLYNAAGVDITSTAQAPADINGTVAFSTDSSAAFIGADNTIYFSKVGDKADVKGTFTFYDPDDNYKAVEKTTTETIVAVEADATTYVSSEYSIGSWGAGAGIHRIPVGDPATELKLSAKFQRGTDTYYVGVGGIIPNINKALQVKVADEHFAMIDTAKNVKPVNEGSTNFVLYYTTDDNREVVLGVLPFDVTAKRKATRVSATAVNRYTGLPYINTDWVAVSNGAIAADQVKDKIDIRISLYDQYNDRMAGKAITITDRADASEAAGINMTTALAAARFVNSDGTPVVATLGNQDVIWTLDHDAFDALNGAKSNEVVDMTKEAIVAFNVKIDGITTVVSFRAKDAGNISVGTAKDVKDVVYATGNTLDTRLTVDMYSGDALNVKMRINKVAGGAYFVGTQKFDLTTKEVTKGKDINAYGATAIYDALGKTAGVVTGSTYLAKITYNGSLVEVTGDTGIVVAPSTNNAKWQDAANTNHLDKSIIFASTNALLPVDQEYDYAAQVNDTLIFDTYNATVHEKLAKGTYNVIFYKVKDAKLGDNSSDYEVLGSRGITVKDSQNLPTFTQKSQVVDASTDAEINKAYEFKWNNNVIPTTDITFETQENASTTGNAVYVYYAKVTVKADLWSGTNDAKPYTFVVPVKELLKVNK